MIKQFSFNTGGTGGGGGTLPILGNGTTLTANATSINFGAGLTATVSGNDVTVEAGAANVTLLANAALNYMPNNTVKGNVSGATAVPSDLSGAQITAILANFSGDSGSGGTAGIVPAPAAGDGQAKKVLLANGTWGTNLLDYLIFGNGADGALSISSGTTSTTRDWYYSAITITGTSTNLKPSSGSNYKTRCSGWVNVASTCTIGNRSAVGLFAPTAGTMGASGNGASGSVSGVGATAAALTNCLGGAGGDGGAGATIGGKGGVVTAPTAQQGGLEGMYSIWQMVTMHAANAFTLYTGGTGGGGGSGDTTNMGGNGGAGGPITWLAALGVTGNGIISAQGNNGSGATTGNTGGGGGGGGGCIICISHNDTTGTSLTFDVSGGLGGAKSGTGTTGAIGATGNIYRYVI